MPAKPDATTPPSAMPAARIPIAIALPRDGKSRPRATVRRHRMRPRPHPPAPDRAAAIRSSYESARERERAPEEHTGDDDAPPVAKIADDTGRKRGKGKREDVGRGEQAELGVGEMEVVLQRLEQREDDVANDVAQEVGDGQQAETEVRTHRRATVSAPPPPGCMCESDSSARRSRKASAARTPGPADPSSPRGDRRGA